MDQCAGIIMVNCTVIYKCIAKNFCYSCEQYGHLVHKPYKIPIYLWSHVYVHGQMTKSLTEIK